MHGLPVICCQKRISTLTHERNSPTTKKEIDSIIKPNYHASYVTARLARTKGGGSPDSCTQGNCWL